MKKTIMVLLALAGASLAADSFSITAGSAVQKKNYNVTTDEGYADFGKHAANIISASGFDAGTLYGGGATGVEINTNLTDANGWAKRESSNVGANSFNIYGRYQVGGEWFMAANEITSTIINEAAGVGTLSTSISFSIKAVDFTSKDYAIALGIVKATTTDSTTTCELLGDSKTITLTSSATAGQTVRDALAVTINNFEAEEGTTYYSVFRIIGPQATGTSCNTASFTDWTAQAGAAVPEPATATLSLLALAGLAARRRRK